MLLYLLPLFALAMIIVPLVIAIRKVHAGVKFNRKKSILLNCGMFLGTMILMTVFMPVLASAEGAGAAAAAAAGGASAGGASVGDGMKYLAAALPTALATIGTGIAVGNAASAAIGAVSEDDKIFSKALIFVALGEGVAIYGILVSILILNG